MLGRFCIPYDQHADIKSEKLKKVHCVYFVMNHYDNIEYKQQNLVSNHAFWSLPWIWFRLAGVTPDLPNYRMLCPLKSEKTFL